MEPLVGVRIPARQPFALYGLSALAMSTGSFDETFFTVAWPTGEFAGMGLEGSIKLGRRAALSAITDLAERKARYDQLVADAGTVFEGDDVIDPVDTRRWLAMGLDSVPPLTPSCRQEARLAHRPRDPAA